MSYQVSTGKVATGQQSTRYKVGKNAVNDAIWCIKRGTATSRGYLSRKTGIAAGAPGRGLGSERFAARTVSIQGSGIYSSSHQCTSDLELVEKSEEVNRIVDGVPHPPICSRWMHGAGRELMA